MVLMKVLSRQKAESVPLKEVFFTKQWKKVMFICQRKNKISFSKVKESIQSPYRRSTVHTSPHKLHLFHSLERTWALSLVVHCTAGTTSVASPKWASSTLWLYGGHIFSSMRNDMCHKAHRSRGVGRKPTSTESSSMRPAHGIASWGTCPPIYTSKKQYNNQVSSFVSRLDKKIVLTKEYFVDIFWFRSASMLS